MCSSKVLGGFVSTNLHVNLWLCMYATATRLRPFNRIWSGHGVNLAWEQYAHAHFGDFFREDFFLIHVDCCLRKPT